MGMSILAYSWFPLVGALGIRSLSPILFIGFSHVVSFFTFAALVLWRKGGQCNLMRACQALSRNRSLRFNIVLDAVLNLSSHFLLFYSFLFISRANATVVFETWPFFGMIGTSLLLRHHFDKLSQRSLWLGMVAMLGLALVVWAGQTIDEVPGLASHPLKGALAAVGSAVAMAASVSLHVKARLIIGDIPEMKDAALITNVLAKGISSIFFAMLLIAFQPWDNIESAESVVWIFVLLNGALIISIGSATYSEALARSSRSELILLWYLTPLIAVFWLWLFGLDQVTEMLVLGGLFIISANLLLHVQADDGPAYVAVFLVLCVTGTALHLTPAVPISPYFPSANLVELISLPLGIFGILTGFVLSRQFSRRQEIEAALLEVVPSLLPNETEQLEATLRERRQADIDTRFQPLYRNVVARDKPTGANLLALRVKLSRTVSHGELIVLWALSLMASFSVVLFRAPSLGGDIVALLTVPAVIYLVVHVSFNTSGILNETVRWIAQPMAPAMRSRVWDRRVATLTVFTVFLAQIALAFERVGLSDVFAGH